MIDNKKDIEKELNHIKKDVKTTNIVKNKFINEIRNGLGDEIKESLEKKVELKEENKTNFIIKLFKRIFKL